MGNKKAASFKPENVKMETSKRKQGKARRSMRCFSDKQSIRGVRPNAAENARFTGLEGATECGSFMEGRERERERALVQGIERIEVVTRWDPFVSPLYVVV